MKKSICFLIGIFLSFSFWFASFTLYGFDSFASSETYTLSPDAYSTLSGNDGAFSNIMASPANIPFYMQFLPAVYDSINAELRESFGWDLEDVQIKVVDQLTEAPRQALAALGAAAYTNYTLAQTVVSDGINYFKTLILADFDENFPNLISDTSNKAIVYVDDDFLDSFSVASENAVDSGEISNISQTGTGLFTNQCKIPIYASVPNDYSFFVLKSSIPVVYYFNTIANKYQINFFIPSSYTNLTNIFSGSYYITTTGMAVSADLSYTFGSPSSVETINGVSYRRYSIDRYLNVEGNLQNFYSSTGGLSYTATKNWLSTHDPYNMSVAYEYDDNFDLREKLDELVGHYVTSDDLAAIYDAIQNIPVSSAIPIGGTIDDAIPTALPTDEAVAALDDAIAAALDHAIALDEELAGVYDEVLVPDPPTPDPVIPDFDLPDFVTGLMPLDLFDIFQPIFDIVGTEYSSYSLWLAIPSFVGVVLLIYFIVSVL